MLIKGFLETYNPVRVHRPSKNNLFPIIPNNVIKHGKVNRVCFVKQLLFCFDQLLSTDKPVDKSTIESLLALLSKAQPLLSFTEFFQGGKRFSIPSMSPHVRESYPNTSLKQYLRLAVNGQRYVNFPISVANFFTDLKNKKGPGFDLREEKRKVAILNKSFMSRQYVIKQASSKSTSR